jgi:hypothetical protein
MKAYDMIQLFGLVHILLMHIPYQALAHTLHTHNPCQYSGILFDPVDWYGTCVYTYRANYWHGL